MIERFTVPARATDATGVPYSGALLYFYQTGTTTLASVYADSALTTPLSNPVVADGGGWFPAMYLSKTVSYRAVCTNADGSRQLFDFDPIGPGPNLEYVTPETYGAVGNGTTDDYAAIVAAAAVALANGVPLNFADKIYAIAQDTLAFPSIAVRTNGATLRFTKSQSTGIPAVTIPAGFSADAIAVEIPSGVTRPYGIIATGDDINIGLIKLTAVSQQAQLALATDYGVKLYSGSRFRIGKIAITNYDRAVVIDTTNDSEVVSVDVTSYVRGLFIQDNLNLYVGKSDIKTRSANGSTTAGHNGVLFGRTARDQQYVTLEDFTVNNSGEHAIRIGGGPQKNIRLVRPNIFGAGRCGIKILGTDGTAPVLAEYHENVTIVDPVIEDCGVEVGQALNECGILVQRTNHCVITNPIVRNRVATNPAYFGIRGQGFTYLTIVNPMIRNVLSDGLYFSTDNSGESDASIIGLTIIGGRVRGCGDDGFSLVSSNSKDIADVTVTDLLLQENSNRGFVFSTATSGTLTNVTFKGTTYKNATAFGLSNSTGVTIDMVCDPSFGSAAVALSTITCANGSQASDGTSLNYRKAGAWVAL